MTKQYALVVIGTGRRNRNKVTKAGEVYLEKPRIPVEDVRHWCAAKIVPRCKSDVSADTREPTLKMDGFRCASRHEIMSLCTLIIAQQLLSLDW